MISASLVVQCLALVLIAFTTESAAQGNASHPVPADQNATTATDAEKGPPWERSAICSAYAKCKEKRKKSDSGGWDARSDGGDRVDKDRKGDSRRGHGRHESNEDRSWNSEERRNSHYCDHDSIRRLERKCGELRDCCPRLERWEENNDSREARKLTEMTKHLRDELERCESRRSRVGESIYRKFNSAISTKKEGGVEWDDDEVEEEAGD